MNTEKNEKRLEEQQAPLKNTDNAFVEVAADGSPRIPSGTGDQSQMEAGDKKEDPQNTNNAYGKRPSGKE